MAEVEQDALGTGSESESSVELGRSVVYRKGCRENLTSRRGYTEPRSKRKRSDDNDEIEDYSSDQGEC